MKSTRLRRRKNSLAPKANTVVVYFSVVAAGGWILLMSQWLVSLLFSPSQKPVVSSANVVMETVDSMKVSPIDVWPDNTEAMDLFRTLKECDPTKPEKKCLQHIPEGTTTHRVAILSPPGELADFIVSWIKSLVHFHASNETDIALLPTAHVPPYGYGRNHGYTKIIRIASFPMTLAAADTARSASSSAVAKDVHLDDLKEVTRQIVRWHCRLSHVAAHTAMLTITLEDLIEDPYEIEEKLCSFLGLTKQDPEVGMEEGHMDEDKVMKAIDPILDHVSDLVNEVDEASETESMESVLNAVVAEELRATNDLKVWPCPSFWDVGVPKSSVLSPIARTVAKALSPDCKAEHTTCSVNKDNCEERGDPAC